MGFLLQRLILYLETLNHVELLLRVMGVVTSLKTTIGASIGRLDNHCAIILLFRALFQHV